MKDPVLDHLEYEAARKSPEPHAFDLSVSDETIFTIGLVTLHWAAFYESVMFEIAVLRRHPNVPPSLAAERPDQRQESNLTYLRKLAGHAYADGRDKAAEQYDRNLLHAFTYKAERDKLAHGAFYLSDNHKLENAVVGTYKGRKFKMSEKRLRAVADGISRCHAFILSFRLWLNAPDRLASMRASLDRPDPPGQTSDTHPEDKPHTR